MVNDHYIEHLRGEQPYQQAHPNPCYPIAGKCPPLDFQDLFWLYAEIIERLELSQPHIPYISVKELAYPLGLKVAYVRQGIGYLKDNGYLEKLRLDLKNNFYYRPKKPKIRSLHFYEEITVFKKGANIVPKLKTLTFKRTPFVLPLMSLLVTTGLALCNGEAFAARDTLEQLNGLVEMAEGANKTVAYVAGGTALSVGTIYALAKQNIMVFISSAVLALAAYKGTALVTAGCLI